jgi:hypothetical protein
MVGPYQLTRNLLRETDGEQFCLTNFTSVFSNEIDRCAEEKNADEIFWQHSNIKHVILYVLSIVKFRLSKSAINFISRDHIAKDL